jgi:hypothetical protein
MGKHLEEITRGSSPGQRPATGSSPGSAATPGRRGPPAAGEQTAPLGARGQAVSPSGTSQSSPPGQPPGLTGGAEEAVGLDGGRLAGKLAGTGAIRRGEGAHEEVAGLAGDAEEAVGLDGGRLAAAPGGHSSGSRLAAALGGRSPGAVLHVDVVRRGLPHGKVAGCATACTHAKVTGHATAGSLPTSPQLPPPVAGSHASVPPP